MRRNKGLLLLIGLFQMIMLYQFKINSGSLIAIYFGFNQQISILLQIIFYSCLEVLVVLKPLSAIFQIQTMLKIRMTDFEFKRLTLIHALPYSLLLAMTNIGISLALDKGPMVAGNLRLLISSVICVLVANKLNQNKFLFFICLGIVFLSRMLFQLFF